MLQAEKQTLVGWNHSRQQLISTSEPQLLACAFIYCLDCKWSIPNRIIACQISSLSNRAALFFRRCWLCQRAGGLFRVSLLLPFELSCWHAVKGGALPVAEVIIVWISSKLRPKSYFHRIGHSRQTMWGPLLWSGLEVWLQLKHCVYLNIFISTAAKNDRTLNLGLGSNLSRHVTADHWAQPWELTFLYIYYFIYTTNLPSKYRSRGI